MLESNQHLRLDADILPLDEYRSPYECVVALSWGVTFQTTNLLQ